MNMRAATIATQRTQSPIGMARMMVIMRINLRKRVGWGSSETMKPATKKME